MQKPKITLIGGASQAGYSLASTVAQHPELRGAHLHYLDIDEARLQTILKVSHLVNEHLGADLNITGGTDRREALEESDFLFFSFSVDRLQL
jgi:alpha-galactosidase/6-phospho-beta-glucosidase family protein